MHVIPKINLKTEIDLNLEYFVKVLRIKNSCLLRKLFHDS